MKLNLWNVLSVFTLAVSAGVGVLYLQIFVNPYAAINPFPPPTLPAALILPSPTATLRKMPATWTFTPQSGEKNLDLRPSSTPLPSNTPVNFPTNTPTPTPTETATSTRTRTKTSVYSTRTPTDDTSDEDTSPTHTPKPKATKTKTRTPSATTIANVSSVTENSGLASGECQNTNGSPAFSWTAVSGATSYDVRWSSGGGSSVTNVSSGTSFSPAGVSSDKYDLAIRTVFGSVTSDYSATLFKYCYDTDLPGNPTDSKELNNDVKEGDWYNKSSLLFTWSGASDATSGVYGYQTYWGMNSSGTNTSSPQTGDTKPVNANVAGSWYLRVRAVDNAGNKASDWATLFTYMYDGTPPSKPGNINHSTSPENKITFNWDASSDSKSGFDHYELYYGTNKDASSSNKPDTSDTSFTGDMTETATYWMKVRAVDKAGNKSDWGSDSYDFTAP